MTVKSSSIGKLKIKKKKKGKDTIQVLRSQGCLIQIPYRIYFRVIERNKLIEKRRVWKLQRVSSNLKLLEHEVINDLSQKFA